MRDFCLEFGAKKLSLFATEPKWTQISPDVDGEDHARHHSANILLFHALTVNNYESRLKIRTTQIVQLFF